MMPTPPVSAPSPDVLELLAPTEALLLDYNGTLSDDEELLAELVDVISREELGIAVERDRYFSDFAGFTEERMFAVLGAESDRTTPTPHELMRAFNARYLERTQSHSTISDEARAFVLRARELGKRVMVVTAASEEVVIPALKQAELLDELEGVIALEDVASAKPEPEGYLLALARLGLSADQAVAFEDSRTGMQAALGASLRTVAVLGSIDEQTSRRFTPHAVHALHPALLPG